MKVKTTIPSNANPARIAPTISPTLFSSATELRKSQGIICMEQTQWRRRARAYCIAVCCNKLLTLHSEENHTLDKQVAMALLGRLNVWTTMLEMLK